MFITFSIKYGSTIFTNKIAEMGEPFCRKLSVNQNFLRKKNVAETIGEIGLTDDFIDDLITIASTRIKAF